jgi:hypothetical protein
LNLIRLPARWPQGRHEDPDQQPDDADHDKQLDQRESPLTGRDGLCFIFHLRLDLTLAGSNRLKSWRRPSW